MTVPQLCSTLGATLVLVSIGASSVNAASSTACVIGTDPVVADDLARIAALRTQVAMRCPCFDYDGATPDKGRADYLGCTRDLVRAAVDAGTLRRECGGFASRLYKRTNCGEPPPANAADRRIPCIEQRISTGRVRCRIKQLGRCAGSASVTRAACDAIESCVEAADDNANYVVDNDPVAGDDGSCAHDDPIVRFVAVGDTGKGNAGQLEVAAAIEAKCAASGCDFVQLLGDNIYESGVTSVTDPQWQTKFETPYADIVLPFYVVLGNHDYGGGGVGNEFGKEQHEIDYSGVSPKWKLPAAYYRRTWRHVELFGLDTNAQIYSMDADQRSNVAAWLASSTAAWRIAVGHHPYRSNGPHGNAGSYDGIAGSGAQVKSFMDDVVCGKADVYLSGHDHSVQWLTPTCAGTELIVSGAGASPTTLPGGNSTHYQTTSRGFVYVVIDDDTFSAEVVDSTGTTLFTRSLTKP